MRKHLPIDALAHLTILLSDGLSRFPLVLKMPAPAGEIIPSPLLIAHTYKALKVRSQLRMLSECDSRYPPHDYYTYPCRLDPHPFMGLDKFLAGRLRQMRTNKSYLATHPSWWSEDPDTSAPDAAQTSKRSCTPSSSASLNQTIDAGTWNRPDRYKRTALYGTTNNISTL